MYMAVAGGGYYVYVQVGIMKYLPKSKYIGIHHAYIASAIMFLGYASFCASCWSNPGIVHKKNHKKALKRFDFDTVMFVKGQECRTCKFEKPARSKHCALCNNCVEKFDHHCIWINNCVGLNNYRWFLSFLFTHALVTIYGAVAGVIVFYEIVERENLLKA
jgi:palmitoyltransferase